MNLDMNHNEFQTYSTFEEAMQANNNVEPPHQCELCDNFFYYTPIIHTRGYGKHAHINGFCSQECLDEHLDWLYIDQEESVRQFEMYGDDLDSWYR